MCVFCHFSDWTTGVTVHLLNAFVLVKEDSLSHNTLETALTWTNCNIVCLILKIIEQLSCCWLYCNSNMLLLVYNWTWMPLFFIIFIEMKRACLTLSQTVKPQCWAECNLHNASLLCCENEQNYLKTGLWAVNVIRSPFLFTELFWFSNKECVITS